MAQVLDIQTVGGVLVLTTDTDPRWAGGTPSAVGTIAMAIDGSGIFTKIGSSDTAYISGANPYGEANTYFLSTDFDAGGLNTGWSQSTNAGGSTDFTQVAEDGVIGIARIRSGALVNGRCGIQYNTQSFIGRFTDAFFTKNIFRVRWDAGFPTANSSTIFGWCNTNAAVAGAVGNSLCVMYDPSNISGYNPTLITNLFLLARTASYGIPGNTVVDLGVLPDSVLWHNWSIIYDNTANDVKIIYDNNLIYTLTDLSNVPGGSVRGTIPPAAGAMMSPTIYVGNSTAIAPLSSMQLRCDKISVYKPYNV